MTPSPRHVTHLPMLDGLRAIAVLLVLWAHVPPAMPGYPYCLQWLRANFDPGIHGVDLFFVLSGFLITRILLAEKERQVPLRWFLLRRLLRIFPIYYLLLAVVWAARGGAELPWCALYLSNLFFVAGHNGGPLEHTWSLCVEEHFYLLWPPVVAFGSRRQALLALRWLVLPLAVTSIGLILAFGDPERLYLALHYLSPVRFLSLGVGCLLAFGEGRIAASPARFCWCALALLVAGLCVSNGVLFRVLSRLGWMASIDERLWPLPALVSACLCSTAVVLFCVASPQARSLAWLRSPPLRGIGRISYGIYLYHWPIFGLVNDEPVPERLLLALLLTFTAATVSYLGIERPLLRLGARFR